MELEDLTNLSKEVQLAIYLYNVIGNFYDKIFILFLESI